MLPCPTTKAHSYGIGSDPEQKNLVAQMMFIFDPIPAELKNTPAYFVNSYIRP